MISNYLRNEISKYFVYNAKITFATGVVRFICLRFSLRFSGIVGMTVGYDLCVYINTAIVQFL